METATPTGTLRFTMNYEIDALSRRDRLRPRLFLENSTSTIIGPDRIRAVISRPQHRLASRARHTVARPQGKKTAVIIRSASKCRRTSQTLQGAAQKYDITESLRSPSPKGSSMSRKVKTTRDALIAFARRGGGEMEVPFGVS